jgi:hypothetical protein
MVRAFFRHLATALKDLLTAKDGETYAPARVYWCLGALQFLVLAGWSTILHAQAFNGTDYGTGLGLILVAGGAGVWLTRKTEPGQ